MYPARLNAPPPGDPDPDLRFVGVDMRTPYLTEFSGAGGDDLVQGNEYQNNNEGSESESQPPRKGARRWAMERLRSLQE